MERMSIEESELTREELTEMWYQDCDSCGYDKPRKLGYIFPVSRQDLIAYYNQLAKNRKGLC